MLYVALSAILLYMISNLGGKSKKVIKQKEIEKAKNNGYDIIFY